jgi:hypothetical protein
MASPVPAVPSPWAFTDFPDGRSVQDLPWVRDGADPRGQWLTEPGVAGAAAFPLGAGMSLALAVLWVFPEPWNVAGLFAVFSGFAVWVVARSRRPDKFPPGSARSRLLVRQPSGPRVGVEEQVEKALAQSPLKGWQRTREGAYTSWSYGTAVLVTLMAVPHHGPGSHPDGRMVTSLELSTIGSERIAVHRRLKGLLLEAVEGVDWRALEAFEVLKTAKVVE